MPPLENTRRENYCQYLISGMSSTEACKKAGYSEKTANAFAAQLKHTPEIQERIKELQGEVARYTIEKVMSPLERKIRLSEFARADLEEVFPKDQISAIKELNLMTHEYDIRDPNGVGNVFNIIVMDKETKDILSRVKERTKLLVEGQPIDA
jgi:phage terminase small subunit